MARPLNVQLDELMTSAETRRPAFRVDIYDVRSTDSDVIPSRINDVVLNTVVGVPLPSIVGPRDFTDDVQEVRVSEKGGDFVDTGVAANRLEITIVDPAGELDPLTGSDGRWLRQRNVVVLREGDSQVAESLWPVTFTGRIVGQAGQNRNRTTRQSVLTVSAVGREEIYLRQESTSDAFPQNTTFRDMVEDIALNDMGLDRDELDFPASFGNDTTCQLSTQMIQQSPLVSIANILFVTGQLPKFQGDGRLGLTDGNVTKGAARAYTDDQLTRDLVRPQVIENGPNVVVVLGLSCDLTQVTQARQVLATASLTSGFFSANTDIPVRWSDDSTQQAKNIRLEVIHSIGSGLFQFGTESLTANAEGTGGTINVEGALDFSIVAAIGGAWLVAHSQPDGTTTPGGPTIPIGRLVEGTVGKLLFSTLGTVARGQYEVTGEPFEFILEEIRAEARVSGLAAEDVREVEIQNQMISTQADGDSAALRVLTRERKKQNARQVRMVHDLLLEPDDIWQDTDGARYMIRSIQRTLRRDGDHEAVLDCFEVTQGVTP